MDRRGMAISAIRKGLIERKMTQAELADAADCHEKTIQNLIAGKSVRDQTLFDVCMVLGLDFEAVRDDWHGSIAQHDTVPPTSNRSSVTEAPAFGGLAYDRQPVGGMVAPIYMGAYSKHAVDHYVGSYLTLRPDFTHKDRIVAYRTDIAWDDGWPSLLFQESGRPDQSYAHRGRLYVP
ncbi:MAG: helix-turn-helix transcriptional regulator, partial [Hyphomicrobiaceae bacterium]|nr:helix-turn-helix transcriptional regulator [Hyphomicrobiaceae bacterium]